MSLITKIFGGKSWNPKDYAQKVKGVWALTPGVFYPAMIQHIQETLAGQDLPAELIDIRVRPDVDPCLAARRYRNWARRIPGRAWEDALRPLADVFSQGWNGERLLQRAEALECARLWFTRALKNAEAPAAIRIRILRDERYKLGTDRQFHA